MELLWGAIISFVLGFAIVIYIEIKGGKAPKAEQDDFEEELDDEIAPPREGWTSKRKNSHYCDGDCANCPPHYGYRYGRWYYGHGHQRGCTRGGNGGATGKTYRD